MIPVHPMLAATALVLILACAAPASAMTTLEKPQDPATLPGNLRQNETATATDPVQNNAGSKTNIITTPQGIIILPPGGRAKP